MLTLQISEAEIAELKYEMYYRATNRYPDALVQKRFHSIYLNFIAPELSCQKIGLYVGLSRQRVSVFIQLCSKSGIQSLKFNNYGKNHSELENHSETLLSKLETQYIN